MMFLVVCVIVFLVFGGIAVLSKIAAIEDEVRTGVFEDKKISKYTANGFAYIVLTEKADGQYITELFVFNRMDIKDVGTIKFQKTSSCYLYSLMTHINVCRRIKRFCLLRTKVRKPDVGKTYELVSVGDVECAPEDVVVLAVYPDNKKCLVKFWDEKNRRIVWVSDLRKKVVR